MKSVFILLTILYSMAAPYAFAANWNMPTPYGQDNHPTQIAIKFASEVAERTNGRFKIKVHPGGSLVEHAKIPAAITTGNAPIGEIFIGSMGSVHPIFKIDNIPFLATNYDDAKKLFLVSKAELEKQLAEQNMLLLYTVPWPAQSLYAKTEVQALQDLEGLKMRAYSPTTTRLAELMGAIAVDVPFSEITQAFNDNKIDAMITSPSTGVTQKSWQYLNHYSDIKAWIPKNMVVVNREAFNKLSEREQTALLGAATNAQTTGWEIARQKGRQHTNVLRKEGIQVSRPSLDLLEELRNIGHVMTNEWAKETGESGAQIISLFRHINGFTTPSFLT